ncbi:hypothetical protein KNO30_00870 [Taylorella equigenitalis]|uniref:hypothetical protein n=1 Tax=Taylorella equigenitalis TaxID=29575 RepID=UPI000412527F|nr:hypothetical protein [Taylorella equigenitalis]WDU48041.1 hypothetical protein KNO30_00870 [Taylorella equigenitalis]
MHKYVLSVLIFLVLFSSIRFSYARLFANYFRRYELRELILPFEAFYLDPITTNYLILIGSALFAIRSDGFYYIAISYIFLLLSALDLRLNLVSLRCVFGLVLLSLYKVSPDILELLSVFCLMILIIKFWSFSWFGTGDILLLLALKLHFNTLEWLNMIVLSCVLGIGFGMVVRIFMNKKLIPFAPCICLSAYISL